LREQRQLREQRRVREALLLDLGALVYELHRQGKRAPELLQRKAAELTVVDDEVRELEAELAGRAGQPHTEPETEEADVADLEAALDDEAPPHDEPDEEPIAERDEDADQLDDETDDEPALTEHEEPRA
jgi:hypothetical protein